MKTSVLHLLLLLCIGQAVAQQSIKSAADFDKVVATAREQHKPIFLDFYTTWCAPCKQMDKLVFSRPDVQQVVTQQFVSARIDAGSSFGLLLKQNFNVEAYPTLLYLDDYQVPLYTQVGSLDAKSFIDLSRKVVGLFSENKPVSYYEQLYEKGERGDAFMKRYLQKMIDANLDVKLSDQLGKYLAKQPADSLYTPDNFQFVLSYVADCNNPYFHVLEQRHTRKLPFATVIKADRSYNKAIKNCLSQAIRNKDNTMFKRIEDVELSDSTNMSPDVTLLRLRLNYYKETDQDSLYIHWMNYYMDKWAGSKDDSLINVAQKAYHRLFQKEKRTAADEAEFIRKWMRGDKETMAINLNDNAFVIYEKNGSVYQLKKALQWSRKSTELLPEAAHFDTYAHLLYKLDQKEEAVKQQKKAIDVARQANEDSKRYEAEYNKMVLGQL
ncbi:thioredoxin family protein [Fibrella aquatilis]|uniref:Thioredoxin family protein n=1 Tax=Fibrella aquatilis TaxID=2817059 RepID=A0A939G5Y4_9BACT|nr:thioredoxin family protein [Fibrella aquatilis]MBO0930393.1 thioredoxin family protein [Fibrella aquatilis]